ncbi:hypothetical protein BpHYR1_044976 [Brachionus plicatilis]|uniref:Uncharacterized protein n=1 Tax=Brachionus plicatilis TaxID=10195 RepID=A0A3M7Q6F0_BRAPC|nr:hypothetical protein BpHYR1_044976 [Brachionus plicatilis]
MRKLYKLNKLINTLFRRKINITFKSISLLLINIYAGYTAGSSEWSKGFISARFHGSKDKE